MPPIELLAEHAVLYIEIAMVIFMAVFLAIVLRLLLARPDRYRDASRIPLDDHVPVTGRNGGAQEETDHAR